MRYVLSILSMLFVYCSAFSQCKEKRVNLVFFDKKIPKHCAVCDPKNEAQIKENEILLSFMESTKKELEQDSNRVSFIAKVKTFATENEALSNFGKAHLYYLLAYDVMRFKGDVDSVIYNVNLSRVYLSNQDNLKISLNQALSGATEIRQLLNLAASFTDEKGKEFLEYVWLEYVDESSLLYAIELFANEEALNEKLIKENDWIDDIRLSRIEEFTTKYEQLMSVQLSAPLLNDVSNAYHKTGFHPNQEYFLLIPSFNLVQGAGIRQFGAEIALELANFRNPYKIFDRGFYKDFYMRYSAIYLGMNQLEANSRQREFYFGAGRSTHIAYVYANIFQFGWKQGLDSEKFAYWFYRPEAGFSYGNFQIFYSFTRIFNKEMRPFVQKHALNLRITLPYLRVESRD